MKKKIIYVIIVCFIVIIGLILFNFLLIKFRYSDYVVTLNNIDIYDENFNKIGNIEKNTYLQLDGISKNYYKLKNYNYYIKSINIKSSNKKDINNNYYSIKTITSNLVNLYQEDNIKITINDYLKFDLLYTKDDKYYVEFMNDIYYIKDNFEIVDTDKNFLEDILFIEISDNISTENLNNLIIYLKNNNYNTITFLDFENWKLGNINYKLETTLIIYDGSNTDIINLLNENNIIFNKSNNYIITEDEYKIKRTDKNYYKYIIDNSVNINKLDSIINGKKDSSNQKVAVLNYHFFYSGYNNCRETICLELDKFKEQLQYLQDNNYKTLTMQEFVDWFYNEKPIPDNSVLITIDDGALGTSTENGNLLIPTLEEYEEHATLFLITAWWDINNYKSDYLDVESHGYDIHERLSGCGTKINCLSESELREDLIKSFDIVKSKNSFCYPFYSYNNTAINILNELGIKVAFAGGNRKAKTTDNKYLIPRYVIYDSITLEEFIKMVS